MPFVKGEVFIVGMGHVDRARSEQQRCSPRRQQGDVGGIREDRRLKARNRMHPHRRMSRTGSTATMVSMTFTRHERTLRRPRFEEQLRGGMR